MAYFGTCCTKTIHADDFLVWPVPKTKTFLQTPRTDFTVTATTKTIASDFVLVPLTIANIAILKMSTMPVANHNKVKNSRIWRIEIMTCYSYYGASYLISLARHCHDYRSRNNMINCGFGVNIDDFSTNPGIFKTVSCQWSWKKFIRSSLPVHS